MRGALTENHLALRQYGHRNGMYLFSLRNLSYFDLRRVDGWCMTEDMDGPQVNIETLLQRNAAAP